ncbi:MAG: ATP-grasp domain-containing protein [Methylococcales bacterium]|nr:ATP-grasp domain-containing protein [Methylococcaceae bacterium]
MKILIFEYITAGGFNNQEIPDSLAKEGRLMLTSLLEILSLMPQHQVTVVLEPRFYYLAGADYNSIKIAPEQDAVEQFVLAIADFDAIWPIAPEFNGILQLLCQAVTSLDKTILASSASAVAIAGDKYKTYQRLSNSQIATVPTQIFKSDIVQENSGEYIVKPVDGVGCVDSYLLTQADDYLKMHDRAGNYIIQPHIKGDKTSLSCLFKQGKAWLVCVNLQKFKVIDKQYHLAQVVVNHRPVTNAYQVIAEDIARAMPDLWGYVGIDLIETTEKILVLEINPRLTTSFTGIYAAMGINIAEAVLQLLVGEPALTPTKNQAITITL